MSVARMHNRMLRLFLAFTLIAIMGGDGRSAEKAVVQAPKAKLLRIVVQPPEVVLSGARTAQGLRVTAEYADGNRRDVTADCQFSTANDGVAAVSKNGLIKPQANGSVAITAAYRQLSAVVPLTVRQIADNSYNFRNDVLPVIASLGCNQMGCHGSPKGKKRLHLSLFSANPHKDFLQITDKKAKMVDPQAPEDSWFLLKAICDEDHGGGDVTEEGSPEYDLLLDWIANKAPEGTDDERKLTRLEVFPNERSILPGETQRLLVEAYYSDGSMRDVTELALFKSNEEAVATVNDMGLVEGAGYGEAVLMVAYGDRLATTRIRSSQPATAPFPDTPFNNQVDAHVFAKLRSLNVIPSELSTDAEFLRRVYLDVIGTLPTADEARRFHADSNPKKRQLLIDALLERPEYADFYALKWGDILQINRNNPSRLQDKGMWAYYRWLWRALDENKPMDRFVYELVTARGSGYRNGPANFFRVGEGAQGMAEHASTAFLGVRLDCAHCHNHPFEQFTLIDNLGMAAFFTKVKLKRTQEQDEEVIYIADSGSIKNPDTNQVASPKFLGGVELAAVEKAAAAVALTKKVTADKSLAAAKAAVKAAAAKAKATSAASAKLVAQKSAVYKKAVQVAAKAKAAAKAAATELAAAVKQAAAKTEAEKAAGKKIVNQKTSLAKSAKDKAAAAQAALEKATRDKAAAESAAKEKGVADRAAIAKANSEQAAASKTATLAAAASRSADAAVRAVETTGDLRVKLAQWIASPENPYFAKHMSNRVWTWLLGRGIIDEPDDFRSTNPASNAKLLDYLAEEFVRSGYDMKAMFRLILNSRTYQLSPKPNQWNQHDRIHFSHYYLKRLTAEQLAGSIAQVTDIDEKYSGLPLGTRATQLPDVSMRSEFLDLFGRPKRATPIESERTCDTHIGQSLQMISSDYVARKLRDNNGRAAKLSASSKSFTEAIDELYLTALSRLPTSKERNVLLAESITDKQRREKLEDLAWVLMNTKEFLFNH